MPLGPVYLKILRRSVVSGRELRDARRAVRHAYRASAHLCRLDGSPRARVMVLDISELGIGFLGPFAMELGERFVIRLDAQWRQVPADCLVARCGPVGAGGGMFVVGATFVPAAAGTSTVPSGCEPIDLGQPD